MKVNIEKTFKAWLKNAPRGDQKDSISTNGRVIFSYKTPILTHIGPQVVLNIEKYSATTTKQQNTLEALLNENKFKLKDTTKMNKVFTLED